MASSVIDAFRSVDIRVDGYRKSASFAVRKGPSAGSSSGIIASGNGGASYGAATVGNRDVNLRLHSEQLRYFKDTVYAAIRPIATRGADQEFQVGVKIRGKRKIATTKGGNNQLALSREDANILFRKRMAMRLNPLSIKEDAGIEVLEDHPVLDSLEDPNPVATEWQLKYFTIVSLMLTGKAYWHLRDDEDGMMRIWPYPTNWVKPDHSDGPFGKFHLEIPGVASGSFPPIDGEDMCFFLFPDAGNPTGSVSPLQANASGVTIEEHVNRSQSQSYKNGIRPGVILKVGRDPAAMPGQPSGNRRTLTAKQRSQIIEAIKLAYQGWQHHNDPAIVDGLIDEIVPYDRSPQEMDFQKSSQLVQDKIMLGFGVNPISAGRVEGANRASASVADEHLVANVVNPTLRLISEVMTKRIGPRYSSPGKKVYLWIKKATAHDEELTLEKWKVGVDARAVKVNEYRENVLSLPPVEDGEKMAGREKPKPQGSGGNDGGDGGEGEGENDSGRGGGGGGGSSGGGESGNANSPANASGTSKPKPSNEESGDDGKKFITREEFDFFVKGLSSAVN